MNEGIAKQRGGDSHGALRAFRGALQIRQSCFTGADLTHFNHKDFHTLLLVFKEAREMSECTGTQNSVDGAALLAIFGVLCHFCGDSDNALEAYTKSFEILEQVGAFETDEWVAVLLSLGDARSERGDFDGALEAYREIHRIYDRKGALNTYDGAVLLMSIGTAKHSRGDLQGALEFYEKASTILEATGKGDTNTGATLLSNIGMTTHKCGRFVDALNAFWRAHAIRERTGTLDTPEGRQLCQNLERAKQMFRGEGAGPSPTSDAKTTGPTGASPSRSKVAACRPTASRSLSPTTMFSPRHLSPMAWRTGGASPHKREAPVPGLGKDGRSRVPMLQLSGLMRNGN